MKRFSIPIRGFCKSRLPFLLGLLLSCGCSSCLKAPVLSGADAIYFGTISDGNLQTVIRLKVYNPNSGNTKLKDAHVKIYYQNKLVSNSDLDSPIVLKGKDTSRVPINSNILLGNLVTVFPGLLAADSPAFYVEGTCHAGVLGVNWTVPIKETVKLNIRDLISSQVAQTFKSDSGLEVLSLRLSKLPGLETTQFDVMLRMKNRFQFDYELQYLELNLYRKGGKRPLAVWKMNDTINEHAGKSADIPLSVAVNNVSLLSESHFSDMIHGSMDVTLKGSANIAIGKHVFIVPIENTQHIALTP